MTIQPLNSITVAVRSVYGQLKVYPVCQKATKFANIAGTKTLSRSVLNTIGDLGYEIVSQANADWRRAA